MRKIIFLLIALLVVFAPVFVIPRIIIVKKVECVSQNGACSPNVLDLTKKAQGKALHKAKLYVKGVLTNDSQIIDFSSKFSLPNNLQVFIIEREPQVALKTGNQGFVLIDKEGYLLAKAEDQPNLPVLDIPKLEFSVNKVSEELSQSAHVLYELSKYYGVREAKLENSSLLIDFPKGIKTILPLSKDIDVLLGTLSLLVFQLNKNNQEFRIEKSVTVMDLRYKNPVLR